MLRHILVPATGNDFDQPVHRFALDVSRVLGAHLEFLHARSDPKDSVLHLAEAQIGGGFAIGRLMREIEADGLALEAQVRKNCDAFCRAEGLTMGATHDQTVGGTAELVFRLGDEGQHLIQHGRTADLLITGRMRAPEYVALELLRAVLCGIGRPLLIVPQAPVRSPFGTVVIAWKNTAVAARAVTAAMPFIASAQKVVIVSVDEGKASSAGGDGTPDTSNERLLNTLRRHNPRVSAQRVPCGSGEAVEALLAASTAHGAGLLVMGGYGHGRLREELFGGFTRDLLRSAPLPVLMMH